MKNFLKLFPIAFLFLLVLSCTGAGPMEQFSNGNDTGLALTDRITLRLPADDIDLVGFAARIADETLALDVIFEGDEIAVEKSISGNR